MSLKHRKQSTKPNGSDTSLVRPVDWNDEHIFTGGAQGSLLARATGVDGGVDWVASGLGVLAAAGAGQVPAFRALTAGDIPVLPTYALAARTVNGHALTADVTVTKSDVGLGSVEDTALSTWAGSSAITTTGNVASGTWSGAFGAVSGANLTNLTAENIAAGTAGINISGNAATATSAGSASTATLAAAATVLATPRAIYGNNFDGSAALTQAVGPTFGGTGFASYAVGDLLYANTTTSLAKLGAVAAGQVLVSGTAPGWSASPTLTSLTAPTLIGGTQTTSSLTFKATTGVGAAGSDIIFKVGNNGSKDALHILDTGLVGIGIAAPTTKLYVVTEDGENPPLFKRKYPSGQGAGLRLLFESSTGTPSDHDGLGVIFQGVDSLGTIRSYCSVEGHFTNSTAGSTEGTIQIWLEHLGVNHAEYLRFVAAGASAPFTGQLLGALGMEMGIGPNLTEVLHMTLAGGVSVPCGTGAQRGNLPAQIFTSAAAPVSNVSTGETTLYTFTLPASTLGADGQKLRITAFGTFAANSNGKTVKLYFGSTVVSTRTGFGSTNGFTWEQSAIVTRTGAATQIATGKAVDGGSTSTLSQSSPTETLSGAITIKITGQSGTGSGDITGTQLMVEWLPKEGL